MRAGAFSRDFTTSLAPECRAFSGALKIEKLKAPLIPGPEGAVDTNDWCIKFLMLHAKFQDLRTYGSGEEDFQRVLPYMGMATILVM